MPYEFRIRKVSISITVMKCSSVYLYYFKEIQCTQSRLGVQCDFNSLIQSSHDITKRYTTANRFYVLLLALQPRLAGGVAGSHYWFADHITTTFLSQTLFKPNCPALRHFKHASQDSLYTSCHATELLETSNLPAVAPSYFSYTAISTVACLQALFIAFKQAFPNFSIYFYIYLKNDASIKT